MVLRCSLLALGAILLMSLGTPTRPGPASAAAALQTKAARPAQPTPRATSNNQARILRLPEEISLVLDVAEAPGIADPKSFWEAAYDLKIADRDELNARPELAEDPNFGESLLQSSMSKRSFRAVDDRHLTISVPVSGRLRQRLEKQAVNPQIFLLRSTVRLFDAKLERQFVLKINRVWQFLLFPEGRAGVSIKIRADGSYSTWGPVPKVLPPGYSMFSLPPVPKSSAKNP